MSQKIRYTQLSPKIIMDVLNEVQVAADHITHVGYLARPALGVKWDRKALELHRAIMNFHFALGKAFENDRLAVENGKGTRLPNGERKPINHQQMIYRDDVT